MTTDVQNVRDLSTVEKSKLIYNLLHSLNDAAIDKHN